MLKLGHLKKTGAKGSSTSSSASSGNNIKHEGTGRAFIRDHLLVKEVQEMHQHLPKSCRVHFPNPDKLHEFSLTVSPDEGHWSGGRFTFVVSIPEEYNILPPVVKCQTRLWHPNITEDGDVCLSLLRSNSLDGHGWAPTRRLKDVVWGLDSLFSDLLNFTDPLNNEAARQHEKSPEQFYSEVRKYIRLYCREGSLH